MTKSYRHGSIVGPVMLIGLGAVLLLDNLDLLGQSPWTVLLDLWPVILIAAGLDLALGYRSLAGALVAAALALLVLGGSLAWVTQGKSLLASEIPGETVQVELNGVTSAGVELSPVASVLQVGALADSTYLLSGTIASYRDEEVTQAYQRTGGHAQVKLETAGAAVVPTTAFVGTSPTWDVGLTPTIPLDLAVHLVAGQADLVLSELIGDGLDVELVFGQSSIVLPGSGRYDGRVSGVFGQTAVVIPAGLEASVRIEPLLATHTIDSDLRPLPDGRYVTAGYGSAENQVDLVISQVVGIIDVQAE